MAQRLTDQLEPGGLGTAICAFEADAPAATDKLRTMALASGQGRGPRDPAGRGAAWKRAALAWGEATWVSSLFRGEKMSRASN